MHAHSHTFSHCILALMPYSAAVQGWQPSSSGTSTHICFFLSGIILFFCGRLYCQFFNLICVLKCSQSKYWMSDLLLWEYGDL